MLLDQLFQYSVIYPHVRQVIGDLPQPRRSRGRQRLVRHGHLPEREIMTGIGPVAVRCPRVRDRVGEGAERIRFSSAILPPYARRSKSLEVRWRCP
jgi:putative transposase